MYRGSCENNKREMFREKQLISFFSLRLIKVKSSELSTPRNIGGCHMNSKRTNFYEKMLLAKAMQRISMSVMSSRYT